MIKDSEKVDILSTNKIEPIVFINFKGDDIDNISKSVKEIGYEPVIVRSKGDGKYQLCSHPEIFEALKLLGEKKIDCIVREMTEQHGKEFTVCSLFLHPDILPKDREMIVWALWETRLYKSHADLGRKIGDISGEHVSRLCYAKEQREKLFGTDVTSEHISTETLRLIKSLINGEQKRFCDRIKDGTISTGEVRDAIKFIHSTSEGINKAILDGEIPFKKIKNVIDSRELLLKELNNRIEKEYRDPKVIKKIVEKEENYFTSETLRKLSNLIKELEPTYYENIKDETEKKQADSEETISYVLLTRYMFKRGKIDQTKYNTVLKWFNRISKTECDVFPFDS